MSKNRFIHSEKRNQATSIVWLQSRRSRQPSWQRCVIFVPFLVSSLTPCPSAPPLPPPTTIFQNRKSQISSVHNESLQNIKKYPITQKPPNISLILVTPAADQGIECEKVYPPVEVSLKNITVGSFREDDLTNHGHWVQSWPRWLKMTLSDVRLSPSLRQQVTGCTLDS